MKNDDYIIDDRIARLIALTGLRINAIKLNPEKPFTWASGYQMPIYNDNRMFLYHPYIRKEISGGFAKIILEHNLQQDIIAGTSTAGISPGTTLADRLLMPFIYVRDKPKDHGLRNQIEGIDAEKDLEGKRVVLVEDLISTGGSSARAIQALRNANGNADLCLSIFNYELPEADETFKGLKPFDSDGNKLSSPCNIHSLLGYSELLYIAKKDNFVNGDQLKILEEWREDPFGWGEKNGFPPLKKK